MLTISFLLICAKPVFSLLRILLLEFSCSALNGKKHLSVPKRYVSQTLTVNQAIARGKRYASLAGKAGPFSQALAIQVRGLIQLIPLIVLEQLLLPL